MLTTLLKDDAGFIISAELVLIATILVIGMIVGLSEIQHAVVTELNDVADAIGSVNQSYYFSGFSKQQSFGGGFHAFTRGGAFIDVTDDCDNNQCAITCDGAVGEGPKGGGSVGGFGGGYGGTHGGTHSGTHSGTHGGGGNATHGGGNFCAPQ